MTAFSYSAAGYSAVCSMRNAPWLRHDSADSHLSQETNAWTVTGYGHALPEQAGEVGGKEGEHSQHWEIRSFRSDSKSLIREKKKEEFSRSIRSGHQCAFYS